MHACTLRDVELRLAHRKECQGGEGTAEAPGLPSPPPHCPENTQACSGLPPPHPAQAVQRGPRPLEQGSPRWPCRGGDPSFASFLRGSPGPAGLESGGCEPHRRLGHQEVTPPGPPIFHTHRAGWEHGWWLGLGGRGPTHPKPTCCPAASGSPRLPIAKRSLLLPDTSRPVSRLELGFRVLWGEAVLRGPCPRPRVVAPEEL